METIKRINKILDLRSTNSKKKNSLNRLNSIFKTIEERISEYEDR